MHVAVYMPPSTAFSLNLYANRVLEGLKHCGIRCHTFSSFQSIEEKRFDLIWHPYFSGLWHPEEELFHRKEKIVTTLHGVRPFVFSPEDLPENVDTKNRKHRLQKAWRDLGKKTDLIITVSHSAKEEIIHTYNLADEKIAVIYHGVDHQQFKPNMGRNSQSSDTIPTILSVAQYQPVKNIDRLIQAFLAADIPNEWMLHLHLPGFNRLIEDNRIVLTTQGLSENELADAYRNADIFAFPSFHESFGIPVLEAMASGCAVICSGFTATREVCDDAAYFVDPYDEHSIRKAIERLVTDEQARSKLIVRGLERAAEFNWQKCSELHLREFERVLTSTPKWR